MRSTAGGAIATAWSIVRGRELAAPATVRAAEAETLPTVFVAALVAPPTVFVAEFVAPPTVFVAEVVAPPTVCVTAPSALPTVDITWLGAIFAVLSAAGTGDAWAREGALEEFGGTVVAADGVVIGFGVEIGLLGSAADGVEATGREPEEEVPDGWLEGRD